jgi:uncharacterized membrane protein HdeD (DUF308 family)
MNRPAGDNSPREGDSSPLPSSFWILFAGPILAFVVGLIMFEMKAVSLGSPLVMLAGFFACISVLVCTAMVGSRSGTAAGVLAFLGTVGLYATVAAAGCSYMFRGL